jgi:hypothetical protein
MLLLLVILVLVLSFIYIAPKYSQRHKHDFVYVNTLQFHNRLTRKTDLYRVERCLGCEARLLKRQTICIE